MRFAKKRCFDKYLLITVRISGAIIIAIIFASNARDALGKTIDLGGGFSDHGVAVHESSPRGIVATLDKNGRNTVLVWLYDHRGGYALLKIDAENGKSTEFPLPFPMKNDAPYSSLLSRQNKYYTLFGSHFIEFDLSKEAFSFHHNTISRSGMAMTEDDDGVIWAASFPDSGVVSYNPNTERFKDFGSVNKEKWQQYPRAIAVDDAGWVYISIGNALSQIIIFDPHNNNFTPILPQSERLATMSAYVYRGIDGKVYGIAGGSWSAKNSDKKKVWYRLYGGKVERIGRHPGIKEKPIMTGHHGWVQDTFPDGSKLKSCDLSTRTLTVKDANSNQDRQVHFDYTSRGPVIMSVVAEKRLVCGGTAFPMCAFCYDPAMDGFSHNSSYGQWNAMFWDDDHFYIGAYGNGALLEWCPEKPWVPTREKDSRSNPLYLAQGAQIVYRPSDVLVLDSISTVVLAGTPGYGATGGGLMLWNKELKRALVLSPSELLPMHSTMSLTKIDGGKFLGGSTISSGTGGVQKATQAELYIYDPNRRELEWHAPVLHSVHEYTDLCTGTDGLVYGIADRRRFFVFDPHNLVLLQDMDVKDAFGFSSYQQSPRIFIKDKKGTIYILFARCIARVDTETKSIIKIGDSPAPITAGGDYLQERLYFACGSHLISYQITEKPIY